MPLRIRPAQFCSFDIEKHDVSIFVVKWRDPGQHLVDEHAQRPPVGRMVVTRAEQHLRRDVLRRPAECVGGFGLFSKAKIRKLQVAILGDQNVLRLQIPIHYIVLVKIFQS